MRRIILGIIVLVISFSCKKNQLGGNSTVLGKVFHHSKAIAGASVYIKFNAKEFPGTDVSVYDSKVLADKDGNYSFTCYKGDYYLYGVGIDNQSPPLPVFGGTPLHIRSNESITIDIAVTE
jgi:hypothetical protein